jgi:hypothetical protein
MHVKPTASFWSLPSQSRSPSHPHGHFPCIPNAHCLSFNLDAFFPEQWAKESLILLILPTNPFTLNGEETPNNSAADEDPTNLSPRPFSGFSILLSAAVHDWTRV